MSTDYSRLYFRSPHKAQPHADAKEAWWYVAHDALMFYVRDTKGKTHSATITKRQLDTLIKNLGATP